MVVKAIASSKPACPPQLEAVETQLLEITALYVAIEDRFTARVIAKTIKDHAGVPSSTTPATLIDDVFYALTRSLERAAATMDASAFTATINGANERVSADLHGALEKWLRDWNSGATGRRLDSFIAIVNDLETAARNTLQLREHATAQLARHLSGCPQLQRIMACLDDFSHTAK
jgi:hypothetical protein